MSYKLTIDSKTGICDNTKARAMVREVAHNFCSFCRKPLDKHPSPAGKGELRALLA